MQSAETLQTLIAQFCDPLTGKSLGDAVKVSGPPTMLSVTLGFWVEQLDAYKADLDQFLKAQGVEADYELSCAVVAHQVQSGLKPLSGVANVVAVSSAKGGVGKSTTAANIALSLARSGAKVGLLDADIYGPSQPQIFGISGKPQSPNGKTILPLENHGVSVMSIGFLIDPDSAMVWRGPMATGALQQLLTDTEWGELDYLIIDLPPGTGDIQLTLSQKIPVSGALIVTTPQDLALLDVRKGISMFGKVNIPILGVVENMSLHTCSQCGHSEAVFGEGGAERLSEELGLELLGQLPLAMDIRLATDAGAPTAVSEPDSVAGVCYQKVARGLAINLAQRAKDFAGKFPKIVVE
ncbi:MAG: iron-sulfur cluster carrier protein ApbC [Gammaproteobacteria bacterium]|nr:iron-sulfur cluster carrier protein ApbC [Gammaproteobacteria bacterium]